MNRCNSCGFDITGERNTCPLCGKTIGSVPEENYDVFPKIPIHVSYDFIFKITTFIMIITIIVINVINQLFIPHFAIYVPMTLGTICAWIIINVGIKKRNNIPKNIMYEAVIAITVCLLWDYFTGWRGWSVDYVLPSTSAALVVFYFVMGITDRKRLTTYAAYLVVSEIGITAVAVLMFLKYFHGVSLYFASISVLVGISILIAQFVFRGKIFISELQRWLHM